MADISKLVPEEELDASHQFTASDEPIRASGAH
jgi:hypothetical protein